MAGGHQRSGICRIVCGHDAGSHPFSILGGVAARRLALPEASLDSVDVSPAEAEFPMAFGSPSRRSGGFSGATSHWAQADYAVGASCLNARSISAHTASLSEPSSRDASGDQTESDQGGSRGLPARESDPWIDYGSAADASGAHGLLALQFLERALD